VHLLDLLAIFVRVDFIHGDGEVAHRDAARGVADLRILPQVADDSLTMSYPPFLPLSGGYSRSFPFNFLRSDHLQRVNNVLVPLRGVYKLAYKNKYVDENIMLLVENRKIEKAKIRPLSMTQARLFLEHVNPFYRPFFTVAFFTGMRGGEMAALKWENVHLDTGKIEIVETRVYGEEGRPKTDGSYRTIDILPMVHKALLEQEQKTRKMSKYVFLNFDDNPIDVETLRKTAWTKGLKEANIEYRPMIQTRHTFATLMITTGENIGWVQRMMGHASLKMIVEKYYAYVPNMTHNDGSLFVREYEGRGAKSTPKVPQASL
jgi:integrase